MLAEPVLEPLEVTDDAVVCEDPAVLKIGQNVKFAWLALARHGIALAPVDDTMLMSYALDSGARTGHGTEALCKSAMQQDAALPAR